MCLFLLVCFGFSARYQTVSAATDESAVIALINIERHSRGLSALSENSALTSAAQRHTAVMTACFATNSLADCFQHQVLIQHEASLLDRIIATSYQPKYVEENIAWGFPTAQSVVGGWMASPDHKANILSSAVINIGCAKQIGETTDPHQLLWTCDFGTSRVPQPNVVAKTVNKPMAKMPEKAFPSVSPLATPTAIILSKARIPADAITILDTQPFTPPRLRHWWCKWTNLFGC